MKEKIIKHGFLFAIGGLLYVIVELLWRGYSHWSMFLTGGLCFVLIGLINEIFPWNIPLWKQGLIGSLVITAAELIIGYIINIRFGLEIWDYSDMPLNFMGLICPLFSLAWFFVSVAAVFVDDWLRYKMFDEEVPTYRLF